MAHMAATAGHQAACCNVPPVVDGVYTPTGQYEDLGGHKTYVTGPAHATRGVVSIFDIFGFAEQTLQGADIVAVSRAEQQYKVFMPDWFHGQCARAEWFPPDTEEKQAKLGAWFGNNDPSKVAAALPGYVAALKAAHPAISSWGIVGYCWGGKVIELVTGSDDNPFAVAAAAHPAMVDPAGAPRISVPFIMLASGEDPAKDVSAFEKGLSVPHQVETFADQSHGWMAARANLKDARNRSEYARGYKLWLDFFRDHWQ